MARADQRSATSYRPMAESRARPFLTGRLGLVPSHRGPQPRATAPSGASRFRRGPKKPIEFSVGAWPLDSREGHRRCVAGRLSARSRPSLPVMVRTATVDPSRTESRLAQGARGSTIVAHADRTGQDQQAAILARSAVPIEMARAWRGSLPSSCASRRRIRTREGLWRPMDGRHPPILGRSSLCHGQL